ncbi:uncharacterized protein LOC120642897 [Panicum virgatum]|uniref:uncharacterized protein LOC120642897 n=1 Tax=Panicum virgatum TaxID=38727 RepID=UPI0019D532E8|nr:uncharacterized protein LOC120642897 [Panicum virgatum]
MSENNWYCVLTNEAQEHDSPGINPFSKLTIRELVKLINGDHLQLKREHTEDNLEDPDVVRESFEHNAIAEEELEEGVETNNNLEQGQTSSESNGTDPNDDYYTIDSDREPAEWKHRD